MIIDQITSKTLTIQKLLVKTIIVFAFLVVLVVLYHLIKDNLHSDLHIVRHQIYLRAKHQDVNGTTTTKRLSTYMICKSQLSTPLICNKLSEGRISVSPKDNLVTWGVHINNDWGNSLSPYWQARGAAFLSGNSFSCGKMNTNSWISLLPTSVPSLSSGSCVETYPELFHRMRNDSGPDCHMVWAHKCVGGWNHIRDQIQHDTRLAMERWAYANSETIPVFNMSEMVLFDRCSPDTILDHNEYGPMAHSALQYIPKTVTTLYQVYAKARTTPLCDAIRQSHIMYLRRIRPDIVVIPFPGSLWEDFAKLVYGPYVLVIYAGSSFALWSTLANVGHVWIAPLYGGMTPNVGSNFHWINTSILYPNVSRKFNLTSPGNINTTERILEWLRSR